MLETETLVDLFSPIDDTVKSFLFSVLIDSTWEVDTLFLMLSSLLLGFSLMPLFEADSLVPVRLVEDTDCY